MEENGIETRLELERLGNLLENEVGELIEEYLEWLEA